MTRMFLALSLATLVVISFEIRPSPWDQTVRAASITDKGKPPTRPPGFQNPKPKTPLTIQWDVRALAEKFTILNYTYDAKYKRFIWTLQTKQKGPAPRFEAFLVDADGVTAARTELEYWPRKKDYEKGARIQAVLPLPNPEACAEAARATLRPIKVAKAK